jgi:hypothetical protein
VVCLDGIFISDAHTLSMLPNIAGFTLDKELASAFIIITYEPGKRRQKECSGEIDVTDLVLSD